MIRHNTPHSFSTLFKKFRLRSEIESLGEFTDIMASNGLFYDHSLFSHWQNGSRTPRDRKLIMAIIELFIQKGGITNVAEANLIFESVGQGHLTPGELHHLPSKLKESAPFTVPQKPPNLLARESLLNQAGEIIARHNKLLLSGQAGVGKTVLAIELAYRLRDKYEDGVLWFRVEEDNTLNILYSIAHLYNFRIEHVYDKNTLASLVRSALYSKSILYIFDNAESASDIELLLPSSIKSSTIITSKINSYSFLSDSQVVILPVFSEKESIDLFTLILGNESIKKMTAQVDEIAHLLGQLPIAVQLAARQLAARQYTAKNYIHLLKEPLRSLENFSHEGMAFAQSLNVIFKILSDRERNMLASMSILKGRDFSPDVVAHMNNCDLDSVRYVVGKLIRYSLLEESEFGRYRMHPLIKTYIRKNYTNDDYYYAAGRYFSKQIQQYENNNTYDFIEADSESINSVMNYFMDKGAYDEMSELFIPYGKYLWNTGKWSLTIIYIHYFLDHIEDIKNKKNVIIILSTIVNWHYYWSYDINSAKKYALYALRVAKELNDPLCLALVKERLGKVMGGFKDFHESKNNLNEALEYYNNARIPDRIGNTLRYLGETYMLTNQLKKAEEIFIKALNIIESDQIAWNSLYYKNEIYEIVLFNMAIVTFLQNNPETAINLITKSLSIRPKYGSITIRVWSHVILGLLYEKINENYMAKKHIRMAEDVYIFFDKINNFSNTNLVSELLQNSMMKSKIIQQSEILKNLIHD